MTICQISRENHVEKKIREMLDEHAEITDLIKHDGFTLMLEKGCRPGPSFSYHTGYQVIEGSIVDVFLRNIYNYPTTDDNEYLIIPLEVPTIIRYTEHYDREFNKQDVDRIYIFTAEGWRSTDVLTGTTEGDEN